jgi:hypothetical protein
VYKLSPLLAYDKHPLKSGIVLDLPFNESSGAVTHDISKAHHRLTMGGAPAWSNIPSGAPVLTFNGEAPPGVGDYLACPAANTLDLDFTGDYSLSAWVNPGNLFDSGVLIGRYRLDTDGWELYATSASVQGYLTLRHHHADLFPDVRDGCYSEGWFPGWQHMGLSRSGLYPVMYRNGQAVAMTYGVNGMRNPLGIAPPVQDLVIGARFTKNATFFKGQLKNIRAWNRALTAAEWATLFELERDEVGV